MSIRRYRASLGPGLESTGDPLVVTALPAIEAGAGDAARRVAYFSMENGLDSSFFKPERMLDPYVRKAYFE